MNTSSSKPPILGGKTALILGAIFLVIFALFTLRAMLDRSHRAQLEQIQTP